MAGCEPTAEELTAMLDERRKIAAQDHAPIHDEIQHRRRLDAISKTMPALTDEQWRRREAENLEREHQRDLHARHSRWQALCGERGIRYATCRLDNFDLTTDTQRKAIENLREYEASIGDQLAEGNGLILFGPKGTGKDHLVMALARTVIMSGKYLVWQNGMDLFGDIRDSMDSGDSERSMVKRLVAPDVLYLSDPLPPIGSLTEFQAAMLFRVLDGRYSNRKATWATVNVSSGDELDKRMGPQNGDRLKDGAMAIFCDWPSHRRVRS